MRALVLSLLLGIATLGVTVATPAEAQARPWRWHGRGWYSGYYAPSYWYGGTHWRGASHWVYPGYAWYPGYSYSYWYAPGYTSWYYPIYRYRAFYYSPGFYVWP
jgi:hypothetical protein